MIDRMSGRVALLLVTVALLLVLLLGWFVLISPQRSKASKLDSQVGETNIQLDAVTSLLQGPVGRESLAELKVAKIAVPDDPKMSQILRQLSAAASTAGVSLDSITPQPLVPLSGAEVVPMMLSVTGHYFAIQRFLRVLRTEAALRGNKLHATGRLYSVDSIQFTGTAAPATATGQSSGGSTGLIQAALAVNAFVYDPAAVSTAVPTTTDTTTTTAASPTP